MYFSYLLAAACTLGVGGVVAQQDPRLSTGLTLETPSTGVSTTPDGRLFLVYARVDGSTGPQVVEWNFSDNTTSPFPNAEWNSYSAGSM